jgi:putative IMPACT (imprinted ancient) family translation regulator
MTEYFLPTDYGLGEFTEKKSRFIGQVWPVSTEGVAR